MRIGIKKSEADESESIQNQKSLLTDYCRQRNWDIFDIYCDEDYSGTDFYRPDFQRMLADCESGCIKRCSLQIAVEILKRYGSSRNIYT